MNKYILIIPILSGISGYPLQANTNDIYRKPRDPITTIESEILNPITLGTASEEINNTTDIFNRMPAIRLISNITPLHSNPNVKKPKNVALDETGKFLIVVLQEWTGGPQNGGLSIIDVSDPTKPTLLGETAVQQPNEVVVKGNFAFISGTNAGILRIVDISDKQNPQVVGSFNTSGQFFGVDTNGDRTYCSNTSSGVFAFDTTDKTNPTQLSISSDATGFGAGRVRLDNDRNILFVTDFTNQEFHAFDTQSTPPLSLIGSINTPVPNLPIYITLDRTRDLAFVGEFGGAKDTIIKMIDTSDPQNMQEVDEFRINPVSITASIQGILTDDGQLCISHAEGGSNGTAFISIVPYTEKGFEKQPVPFFTGDLPVTAKIQVGAPGDGPVDGLIFKNNVFYLPLLRSDFLRRDGTVDSERGNLIIAEKIDIPIFKT